MIDRIDNILFDLDGTLTDPKEGIINSFLYALEKLGIREENINELDALIGPPLRDSFASRYNLTADIVEKAVVCYRDYFSTKGIYENKIYTGVDELLESLHSKGYKLFVATSKPTTFSEKIVQHFNLDKYFIKVIGSNLDNTRNDKSEIISYLVSTQGLKVENCIMIGDRKHDIIGAKNNSMRSIGVTYGYGTLEELKQHQPDFIVNNFGELKSIFIN